MKPEDIVGFVWDEVNSGKVREHGLDELQVESVFCDADPPCIFRHRDPTRMHRFIALGFTDDERFVLVPFEFDSESRMARPLTAYEPENDHWWLVYSKIRGLT